MATILQKLGQTLGKVVLGLVVVGVSVALIGWVVRTVDNRPGPPPPPPETHVHMRMRAAAGQAMLLRKSMRDPESFEVVSVLLMPADAICYEYRATNGFGGKSVELAVWDGKAFHSQSEAGFTRAYNRTCGDKLGTDVTGDVAGILRYTKWMGSDK